MERQLTKQELRRMIEYPDTKFFEWRNENPRGKIKGKDNRRAEIADETRSADCDSDSQWRGNDGARRTG